MDPTGPVVRVVPGLPTWSGATVLFDGTEQELASIEAGALPCPTCAATFRAGVAGASRPADRTDLEALVAGAPEIVEAADLHRSIRMEPSLLLGSTGLAASLELVRCESCGTDLGVITAHGEHQPGRYVTTLQGIVPVRLEPPPRSGWAALSGGERVAVVAAAVAALAAVVVLGWAHLAAWQAWQRQQDLDRSGVRASAQVVERDAATGRPRSVDRFSLSVRFDGPDGPVEGTLQVDDATDARAASGTIEVRYDPDDPSRFVAAQDGRGLTLVLIVGLVDLALIATIAWERRRSRRAGRTEVR
jgi:hypothetical protein